MESTLRRTWAEIDLDALAYNYRALRQRVGADVKFLGAPVITEYGAVVGQVTELGENWATVSTLIDVDMTGAPSAMPLLAPLLMVKAEDQLEEDQSTTLLLSST